MCVGRHLNTQNESKEFMLAALASLETWKNLQSPTGLTLTASAQIPYSVTHSYKLALALKKQQSRSAIKQLLLNSLYRTFVNICAINTAPGVDFSQLLEA